MTVTRFDTQPTCPECDAKLDAATGQEGTTPKAGDLSLCAYCGVILQFVEPMPSYRTMTDEDLAELDDETRESLKKASESVQQFIKAKQVKDIFMKHFGGT